MPFNFKIFLSYRRADTIATSGRLYDLLVKKFGQDRVFKDVFDIDGGADWKKTIDEVLDRSQIFIILIGKEFLANDNNTNKPRIFNVDDPVRFEINRAIDNPLTQVIPVLVDAKAFPSIERWPEDLKRLNNLNAVSIDNGKDWENSTKELIAVIRAQYWKSIKGSARGFLYPIWRYKLTIALSILLLASLSYILSEYKTVSEIATTSDYKRINTYIENNGSGLFVEQLKQVIKVDSIRLIGVWKSETELDYSISFMPNHKCESENWKRWNIESISTSKKEGEIILENNKGRKSSFPFQFSIGSDTLILNSDLYIRAHD